MHSYVRFIVLHPTLVIAVTLAITIAFGAGILLRGIGFNGSPETLARRDSSLAFFKEIRSTFGDDRVIVVGLTTQDVFTREFLLRLDRLTSRLNSLDGVADAISISNLKTIRRVGDDVVVDNLVPRAALREWDEDRLRTLKENVTRDPLYVGQFISVDGRSAAVSVFIESLDETKAREVADSVEHVARSESNGDDLMIAGVPVMDARGIRGMIRDFAGLSPVAALLCFAVFLASFRSFWGAVLPMASLVMGLIWVIGLMSWLGRPITLATLSLPTVLMAVGSSYIFHVINQYRISIATLTDATLATARAEAWIAGLGFIGPAVIVSGTTTIAGFGALASSAVPTARDMGIYEATGVLFMLVLSLAFVPAALALLSPRAVGRGNNRGRGYARWLTGPLHHVTALILFRKSSVLIVALAATFLIGAGVYRLRINTDYLKIFPRASATVQDAQKLHERLAGAATIQLIVSGEAGSAETPEFLEAVAELEAFASRQPGVDATVSVARIVWRLNATVKGASEGIERLPQDRARLELIFNDYLSKDDSIARLVNTDRSQVAIVLRTNLFSSNELRALTSAIDGWSRSNLPVGVTARATGSVVLLNTASDAIAVSQSSSLVIALVSIYLMMVVLFRSFVTGLLALVPNLLPVICYFGFLGWAGITLDITTSLIASAVLGLAVDNAVHMIRRYRQSIAERPARSATDEGWAMWLTMERSGKPMVLANLMLIAAFLLFMLSSFVPARIGGLLWAVTILACLAADLIFLPALMTWKRFVRPRTWASTNEE